MTKDGRPLRSVDTPAEVSEAPLDAGAGAMASPADIGRRGRDAAFQLLARTVLMRGVTAVGTVVLARVLVPADFGVYAVLLLWVQVLALIGDFGVGSALVQQPLEPTRRDMSTAWVMQQLLWIPPVAVVWIVAPQLTTWFPDLGSGFDWQLRLISLSIPCAMLRALPSAMLMRHLRFKALATIEVVMQVVFYGAAVGLALWGAGVWSFVWALLAQGVVGAVLVNLAWRQWAGLRFDRALARRQLGFGMAFNAASLVGLFGGSALVPIFGGLAGGVTAIGHLQFAGRIGALAGAVDEIASRITFPAFSRLQAERERLQAIAHSSLLGTAVVVGAAQSWLIGAAPLLVPVVFGARWTPAVGALQLICVASLATLPTGILRSVLFGQGRSRTGLAITLVAAGVMLVAFPALVLAGGLTGGGLALALAGMLGLLLHVWAVRDVVNFPWADLVRVYAIAGLAGAAAWAVTQVSDGLPGLVGSGVVFGAVDLGLLALFGRGELQLLWRMVPELPKRAILRRLG